MISQLDNDSPHDVALTRKANELATAANYGLSIIEVPVTADASGANAKTFTVPFNCKIVKALTICKAANTAGTLQVRRATTAITAAVVCAVNDTIAESATLVAAELTLAVGTTYNVLAGGTDATATRGVVQLLVART